MSPLLRRALLIAALCGLSAAGGFGLYSILSRSHSPPLGPAPEIAFTDLLGEPRKLSEWRGKLVLVNFWATWCTPCLHEIPMLTQLQERYAARGLQIIGPAMDDPEAVRNAAPQLGINYPVMVGDSAIVEAMEALGDTLGGLPFSVLIGRDGQILLRKHGEFKPEEIERLLAQYLSAPD